MKAKKDLKMIQVGLGAHGSGIAEHVILPSNDFHLVGLVDINHNGLEEAGEKLGVPSEGLFINYADAFRELDADAVYIATISPVHYEIIKSALENNLHVLVEKPFVLDNYEAQELVGLASQKKLKLMINQCYRYISTTLTLKKAIKEEIVGKVKFVNTSFFNFHEGKPYQKEMDNYMLFEMAIHHIDMIRFLFDQDIISVQGKTWNESNSGYNGDPNVQGIYELESGLTVFYIGSLFSKGKDSPWEGQWRVQCEKGSLHIDDLGEGLGVYSVSFNNNVTKLESLKLEQEGVSGVMKEFSCAIHADREPISSGRDNLNTLEALIATNQSSFLKHTVSVRQRKHKIC